MNKIIPTATILLSSILSSAAYAHFTTVECNDCSVAAAHQQATQTIVEQDKNVIYVVDFVNNSVNKFQQNGDTVTATAMTLSEKIRINNHYEHKRAYLRSAN
ncbi:hypothetical protein ACQKE0_18930 [Shewanella colwelliana]|uniref:hypothetical protein n=1 Tax=Shewanella colwelliana TaxID=23 RepID=UPI003CFC83EF